MPSIQEVWLFLSDLDIQRLQIAVEGTVVKSLEFDLDSISSPEDPPRSTERKLVSAANWHERSADERPSFTSVFFLFLRLKRRLYQVDTLLIG
jgi:hypothetical protein